MKPVRFGLVGLGWIGSRYAAVSRDLPDVVLAGIADIQGDRLATGESVARPFESYEAMAKEVALDAVVICTPPATHPEVAAYFLERGVAVLCEKPFATTAAAAADMRDLARACGVPISLATKYRCLEEVRSARELLAAGGIGDVISFEVAFANTRDMHGSWHSDPAISGGGVFMDAGSHAVDVLHYLFGPIDGIFAIEGPRIQQLPVEDNVRAIVRSVAGMVGAVFVSWNGEFGQEYYVTVQGTRGALRLGWLTAEYQTSSTDGWIKFGTAYSIDRALRNQLTNFAAAFRGDGELVATADDAVADVIAVCAANQSLRSRQWEAAREVDEMNGDVQAIAHVVRQDLSGRRRRGVSTG